MSNILLARLILIDAAIVLGLTSGAVADYKEGIKAAQKGDYITAMREFKTLAAQGHSAS